MATEIDELKELVRRNTALTEDTNRMVHKMRRSAAWGRFFQVAWWLAIIAISGAAYYYYLQPYLYQMLHIYQQIQAGGHQAQDAAQQFGNLIGSWFGTSTPQ